MPYQGFRTTFLQSDCNIFSCRRGLPSTVTVLDALLLGEIFKSSQMSHVGLRLGSFFCGAPSRCASSRPPGKNYQNKAGFSNTVDDIDRTFIITNCCWGVGPSDLSFLTLWSRFFLRPVFFMFLTAGRLSAELEAISMQRNLSVYSRGDVSRLCTRSHIQVVTPQDLLYCSLPRKGDVPVLPLFVLLPLCFHLNIRWMFFFQHKSTSVLDPASFKHFKVCVC